MLRSLLLPCAPLRRSLLLGVSLLATFITPPSLHAQTLLGQMRVYLDGGSFGTFNSTPLTLKAFTQFSDLSSDEPVASFALADYRLFTAADAGFTFTLDPSTAGFDQLAALLANVDDDALFWEHAGGGFGSSETYYEWFYPIAFGGPALAGYSISSLQFTIDSLYFNSPDPEDPWTDYTYDFTMRAYSTSPVPEPSTYAAILGTAALGLAAWRRRRPAVVATN